MFAYRECRLRAPAIAGAAEVQSLTAGNAVFKADLATDAQVGFETVPADRPGKFSGRSNEDRRDAGLTQHRRCTAGTLPRFFLMGISDRPTARARAEG
jgi:hypothetical protein